MYFVTMFALLILGLFLANDALIIAAGLFAIADAITTFCYRFFKR